jgi:nucleoside triphosphate pyrophosphatase
MPKIYLASRSPRRGEILRQIGVDFEILPSDIDESVLPDEAPEHYVLRLAQEKALACIQAISRRGMHVMPLLAADTTVCVDGEILGKPENDEHGAAMLRKMSGRWHSTHTGVAVADGDRIEVLVSSTQVEMKTLTEAEIAAYVASGECEGKAGAYAIQGLASSFISRIEGSYSGVMGLPVFETVQLLNKFGIKIL